MVFLQFGVTSNHLPCCFSFHEKSLSALNRGRFYNSCIRVHATVPIVVSFVEEHLPITWPCHGPNICIHPLIGIWMPCEKGVSLLCRRGLLTIRQDRRQLPVGVDDNARQPPLLLPILNPLFPSTFFIVNMYKIQTLTILPHSQRTPNRHNALIASVVKEGEITGEPFSIGANMSRFECPLTKWHSCELWSWQNYKY